MNILFLANHFNTGGITSYILTLTKGLSLEGHRVFVASAGGDCEETLKVHGATHINLGFKTKSEADPRIYLSLGSLKEFIYKERIDIIHAQTRVTQVMSYFLSRMTARPFISTCHGFFRPRFFRRIFPCWGETVIAVSQGVYQHLQSDFHVNVGQIHKITNGIDLSCFPVVTKEMKQESRERKGLKAEKIIGIIARLSEVKGIDILIRSMSRVVRVFPDALLFIVGQGPQEKELNALVIQLGLGKHIRFEKTVNQTANMLTLFDVFVMPSRQEGLGLSVIEAQACGLAVIASNVGGLPDLIENNKTGYLVDPGDADALAKKIIEVLSNQDQAQSIGLCARKHVEQHFDFKVMTRSTVKVYEQYLSR